MNNKIAVAKIVKPQGIKGEVKLKFLGNDPSELLDLEEVYLSEKSDESIKVLKAWRHKDGVFMALNGVTTRNEAEELRGTTLFIDAEDIEPPEGEYYITDLIGCDIVLEGGEVLGKLQNILQHGAADIYEVKGARNFMMPALKKVIVTTDIDDKVITVNKEALAEVVVYED
jgi:16S rRNA processing protein RimM